MKSLNIALIGYGKLGKSIEQQALKRGHKIIQTYTRSNASDLSAENLASADVIVECSTPQSAYDNLLICANAGIPTLCGTTGWLDRYEEVTALFTENSAFLFASNFSLGMNLTFAINTYLSTLMSRFEYSAHIEETHHTHKLDKPSGTAITLAEAILATSNYRGWGLTDVEAGANMLPVTSHRIDDVPGTHTVEYRSEADTIALTHTAFNRDGFGLGAILAAEYLHDKRGIYTMRDVLGIQ